MASASLAGAESTLQIEPCRDDLSPILVSTSTILMQFGSRAHFVFPSSLQNVAPHCPASCLFRMTEKGASHQRQSPLFVSACRRLPLTPAFFRAFSEHETLRLTVKYRTLDEELRHLLNILLEPLVESHGMTAIKPWFTDNLYAAISSSPLWANVFFARGTVDVLDVELKDLRWRSEPLALDEAGFRSLVEIWESAVGVRTTSSSSISVSAF